MVALLRNHPQFAAYAALAALCFFWGTTYLGIRVALESFEPSTIVCLRNLFSGTVTLVVGRLMGASAPRGKELGITALLGILIIGVGNGTLSYAEKFVPSGLAALFIATSPFWFAGAEAIIPGGEKIGRSAIAAMLIGCLGVMLLVTPSGAGNQSLTGRALIAGFLLLQVSQASWSFFSIMNRRRVQKAHPLVSGGVQQLASGVLFAIPAFMDDRSRWSWNGIFAILYLAVFGGIIGYGCYTLVMTRLPVAVASIYTYINPVVAVALGWLFYREPFGWKEAAGMAIIFLGVALVRRASVALKKPGPEPAAESG